MLRWTARQPCKHCSMYCRRSLSVHGNGRARQRCDENTFSCFTFTSMRLTPTIVMSNTQKASAESSTLSSEGRGVERKEGGRENEMVELAWRGGAALSGHLPW